MKRTLLLTLTPLIVTLTAVAQPYIPSNKETYNSGQTEWKKPVTTEYTIINTRNESLVLTNVATSCACVVVDWTRGPTAPGAKGTVKTSSDAKALGRFDKSIGVYSDVIPNLVYLKLIGEVMQEIKDYSKLLPYTTGNVRIDRDEFSFPNVHCGQQSFMAFSIVNPPDCPYEPVLIHLPPHLKMGAEPRALLKGKKGTTRLTLGASQLQDFELAQTSVYLPRFSGNEAGEDSEMPVSAIPLSGSSCMTERGSLNALSIHILETSVDLSIPLVKENRTSHNMLIANVGKIPLAISKLQVLNSSIGVRLRKAVIPSGGMTKLEVTIHKRDVGNKRYRLRVLAIINNPSRPKAEINIKR